MESFTHIGIELADDSYCCDYCSLSNVGCCYYCCHDGVTVIDTTVSGDAISYAACTIAISFAFADEDAFAASALSSKTTEKSTAETVKHLMGSSEEGCFLGIGP